MLTIEIRMICAVRLDFNIVICINGYNMRALNTYAFNFRSLINQTAFRNLWTRCVFISLSRCVVQQTTAPVGCNWCIILISLWFSTVGPLASFFQSGLTIRACEICINIIVYIITAYYTLRARTGMFERNTCGNFSVLVS